MRDGIAFTRDRLGEAAFELVARRKADRMHEDVELIPVLAQVLEHGIDFFVARNVALEQQVGVLPQAFGQFLDAPLELVVLVGEGEFGTLTRERFCDSRCDRAIARDANDQRPFAGHEAHRCSPECLFVSARLAGDVDVHRQRRARP